MIRVLHCVPGLDAAHGGPSRTVVGLADAMARRTDVRVDLLAQSAPGAVSVPSTERIVGRRIAVGEMGLGLGLPMRRELVHIGKSARPDLVHSHGIWHAGNHWAALSARAWNAPLVVHPRGMLEPWALGHKAIKKRMALALFQRADLSSVEVLVATSDMEYQNLRKIGLSQPVAVIPNGVAFPSEVAAELHDAVLSAARTSERVALFLSRVHPKKGLLDLVRAWGQVAPVGWRLRIAGPDEDGHWSEVSREISGLGLGTSIEYCGPVDDNSKAELYRRADLFVLPTYSENFGVVVAEALAYGVPVITTRAAPWADLETFGCGWWIETGVEPLVFALRQALSLSDDQRQAMGERGRDYVRRYDWDDIAGETVAVYKWVLGRGNRPASIRLA